MRHSATVYLLFVLLSSICLLACDDDEPESTIQTSTTSSSKIVAPSFDSYLTTTDTDGFSIRVRFKTGGDDPSNMSATVYWKAYSKKPTTNPKKNDLTQIESMRQYGAPVYYNTGSQKGLTKSIVYDKSHAGYNSGTYIYYMVECRNSKGSCSTSITFTIIK
jgi:hypothetical protein